MTKGGQEVLFKLSWSWEASRGGKDWAERLETCSSQSYPELFLLANLVGKMLLLWALNQHRRKADHGPSLPHCFRDGAIWSWRWPSRDPIWGDGISKTRTSMGADEWPSKFSPNLSWDTLNRGVGSEPGTWWSLVILTTSQSVFQSPKKSPVAIYISM
jgi:hypothetical protein